MICFYLHRSEKVLVRCIYFSIPHEVPNLGLNKLSLKTMLSLYLALTK